MFEIALGNVPEWLAGSALLVAFVQLGREQQDRRRGQVVRVGAWCDRPTQVQEGPPLFNARIHVRNASDLPVVVTEVEVTWRAYWYVPVLGVDGDRYAQKRSAGSERWWLHVGVVAPQDRWEDMLRYPPPPEMLPVIIGDQATIPPDAEDPFVLVNVTGFVAFDNAGRRWRVRPQVPGGARRVYELPAWARPITRRLRRRQVRIMPPVDRGPAD